MSELDDLAEEAAQMGIVTKEHVCAYLESFIISTRHHIAYRKSKGRQTSYDQMASFHALAAARAIYLLQQKGEE